MTLPVSSLIGPATAPSYYQTFNHYWTEAVARGLLDFRDAIRAGTQDAKLLQYMLSAAKAWADLGTELGSPHEIMPPDTLPLPVDGIVAHLQTQART